MGGMTSGTDQGGIQLQIVRQTIDFEYARISPALTEGSGQ